MKRRSTRIHEVIGASTTDAFLSNLIVLFYYALMVNNVVKRIMNYEGNVLLACLLLIVLVFVFLNARAIPKRFWTTFISSVSIYFFVFISGYLLSVKESSIFVKYCGEGTVFLFFGSAIFNIRNFEVLGRCLKKHSYGFLIVLASVLLVYRSGYIMSHSYLMLLPTLLHLTIFIIDKKLIGLLCSVVDILIILMVGARGPLLVVAAYLVLLVFFFNKKAAFKVTLAILFLLFVYFFFINGKLTYELLTKMGLGGRTVDMLFTNTTYDSGRAAIYDVGRALVEERPFMGWGLAGDTLFLKSGGYVHNIMLELQIDFGKYVGISLFVILNILFAVALLKSKFNWLVLMFVCLGYIPLFVSNSYLLSFDFYFAFFLCLSIVTNRSRKRMKTGSATGFIIIKNEASLVY